MDASGLHSQDARVVRLMGIPELRERTQADCEIEIP